MSYAVVQGDLEPDMRLVCEVNGAVSDLTNTLAANLRWKKPDGTVVTVPLTIVTPTAGLVQRTWVAGDTALVGQHLGQVIITRASGELQTFPNSGWAIWNVNPQLA